MSGFWVAAGALSVLAAAFLLAPLWRLRQSAGKWSLGGIGAGLAVIPAAFLVYSQVTTYEEDRSGSASSEELAMVRQLAERLAASPDDVQGWQLLGRSYMALGEYGRARTAFMEAWERTNAPDTALKLGLGEAMIWTDPASARGQAGDLIEDVLEVEPRNQRALWWGGLVAAERGQADAARSRWETLLASNPPPEVADLIRQQLSMLASVSRSEPAAPADRSAAASSGPVLTLNVSLGENIDTGKLGPDAYVFLFARAPGGGPPIAGVRLPPDALPGTFTLSDANAIIAGRSLAAFGELTIVARVAVSGDPIEQPGDFVAETIWRAGEDTTLELTIDRVVGAP